MSSLVKLSRTVSEAIDDGWSATAEPYEEQRCRRMLLRRQVSEERDEHIDMTPMVDVVFQLMTFMLFSMQMTNGDVVKVPEARHGVGVEES